MRLRFAHQAVRGQKGRGKRDPPREDDQVFDLLGEGRPTGKYFLCRLFRVGEDLLASSKTGRPPEALAP